MNVSRSIFNSLKIIWLTVLREKLLLEVPPSYSLPRTHYWPVVDVYGLVIASGRQEAPAGSLPSEEDPARSVGVLDGENSLVGSHLEPPGLAQHMKLSTNESAVM